MSGEKVELATFAGSAGAVFEMTPRRGAAQGAPGGKGAHALPAVGTFVRTDRLHGGDGSREALRPNEPTAAFHAKRRVSSKALVR
jgi:hypothetical protein